MPELLPQSWQIAAAALADGGVAVVPTDTLYGIVGSALKPAVVERIYTLRQRDADKPLITLLADAGELERFGIRPSAVAQALLERVWPGPVSIILACTDPALAYLHRGSGGVSFRVPRQSALLGLLRQTGPLVAPSANPQGAQPAATIKEAHDYFGDAINAYVDAGTVQGAPSALVDLRTDTPHILRPAPGFRLGS